jgi:hypothetical protein
MRPEKGDPLISTMDQSRYRSGVGMLLYLVKHSRPDISNSVRELTKVLDGATQAHWKAMVRVIKYVLDTKNHALKLQPREGELPGISYLEGFSDSEFAGDRDTRRSVYGYAIYQDGALVSWKTKGGKSVTLSTTEAELFAGSETAKELMFIYNIYKGMYEVDYLKLPIIIRMDNTGAIYLANNYTTGQRTKHIDIRDHYLRELVSRGIIKIIFVKSEENDADIYTKNLSEELFERHTEKYMDELDENDETNYIMVEEQEEEKEDDFIIIK